MNTFPSVTGKSRLLLNALLEGPKSTAELGELLDTQYVATYIMRLRKALGEPGLVHTTFTGYRLELPERPTPVFQLPAPVGGFVGRAEEISWLSSGLPGKVLISGPPGIGKTALATAVGHAVRDRFPGGQLYVNLRGYSPEPPLSPSVVLSRFLRSMGVERVPDDLAGEFRKLMRGSRILVVLDNAASVEQITPLLPLDPTCGVLITSRSSLALDASEVRLGTLRPDEAESLLGSLGSGAPIQRLAEWCGYYPLALRIAAGNLVDRPDVAASVDELLASDRLALAVDDDAEVRRTFDLSFAALSPADASLFGLLGAVPGQDFSVDGAAALAGVPVSLDRLVSANLVQQAGSRYSMHDLLREYALERAGDVSVARQRLFSWYLTHAQTVSAALYPEAALLPPADLPSVDSALAWINSERSNVLAAAEDCARNGPAALSWQLVDAVGGFFGAQANGVEYLSAASLALDAARSVGDRSAEAIMVCRIASAYRNRGELRRALDMFHGVSLDSGNPWLPTMRGTLQLELGDLTAARESFDAVLALGDLPQVRISGLYGLSTLAVLAGDFTGAADMLRCGVDLARSHNLANLEATCLTFLALCHAEWAEHSLAISLLRRALELRGERGTPHLRTGVLAYLAVALSQAGSLNEARSTVTEALDALPSLGGAMRIESMVHHAHGVVLDALGLNSFEAYSLSLELALAASSPYDEMRALLGLGDISGARTLAVRHGYFIRETASPER